MSELLGQADLWASAASWRRNKRKRKSQQDAENTLNYSTSSYQSGHNKPRGQRRETNCIKGVFFTCWGQETHVSSCVWGVTVTHTHICERAGGLKVKACCWRRSVKRRREREKTQRNVSCQIKSQRGEEPASSERSCSRQTFVFMFVTCLHPTFTFSF